MMTTMTLRDLLALLVDMPGTFILHNEHGSMELRGDDLYLHPFEEWLTVYHATPKNPESQSHLHLRWRTVRSAAIQHHAGQTPHLAFYRTSEPLGDPCLLWYFPSFYNWSQGKAEIPAHIARYEAFVQAYGMQMQFLIEAPGGAEQEAGE
jgi:hypothetical protein